MKWCPLILMVIIAVAYRPFLRKIVKSYIQVVAVCPNTNKFVFNADKLERESEYGNKNRAETLQDFLLKQSNVVAGRAIFISGLAQQGYHEIHAYSRCVRRR